MEQMTKPLALKPKQMFTEKNAAFLSQYPTDDAQIDYYTKKACEVFERFEIDGNYTVSGVRKSVKIWYENKSAQMQLFRKHPYWDEEAKAIIFLQTETRSIDYKKAAQAFDHLYSYIQNHITIERAGGLKPYIWRIFYNYFDTYTTNSPLIEQDFLDCWERGSGDKYVEEKDRPRKGTKLTRFIRKMFAQAATRSGQVLDVTTLVDNGDPRTRRSFEKFYAKFADCLSELTVERITCVSLHFCDFMTMSNGNSWSSCHFINSRGIFHDDAESSYRGMYKAGCLSYALDAPSIILYTLPADYDGDEYYMVQKLHRMCCQYQSGVIITGKCYPDNSDELITRYRQIMQLIVSTVEEFPNMWTFSKSASKIEALVNTVEGSLHYRDYIIADQKPTISLHKPIEIDLDKGVTIGHEAYCLDCGTVLRETDWLQCSNHRIKKICQYCGCIIEHDNNAMLIDGVYYCTDHVFFCDQHQQFEPIDHKFGKITMYDGSTRTVCKSTEERFYKCSVCGKYVQPRYTDIHNDQPVCPTCISELPKCEFCGDPIYEDEMCIVGGKKYHKGCKRYANTGISIDKPVYYHEGDYVVIKPDLCSSRHVYVNSDMITEYAGKVVKITSSSGGAVYLVSELDGCNWSWGKDCFAGRLKNGRGSWIGKTIDEIGENK